MTLINACAGHIGAQMGIVAICRGIPEKKEGFANAVEDLF